MIIIPISFGPKTLHNGTTHFAMKSVMPAPETNLNLVKMTNGRWYDPYGTDETAPITPGKITAKIAVIMPTENALSTEIASFYSLLGTRGYLTVQSLNGNLDGCQARIEKVSLIHPFSIVSGSKTKIEIVFQCITRLTP